MIVYKDHLINICYKNLLKKPLTFDIVVGLQICLLKVLSLDFEAKYFGSSSYI